jgi:hypothetical protein
MGVHPLTFKSPFLPGVTKAVSVLGLLCGMADSIHPAHAQSGTGPAFYHLNPDSNLERGCFPPCECPVMITEPVKGTFLLTPIGSDGLFDQYAVSDVNWQFTNYDGTTTLITGSGTYKVGGEVALQQELSLSLQENGGKVEHFDSGLVQDSTPFPNIHVTISTNGQFCFDTAFEVSASPTPAPQLHIGLTETNTLLISWVSSDAFVLQETSELNVTNWSTVTNTPAVKGQENQVIIPLSSLGNRFYRVRPSGN